MEWDYEPPPPKPTSRKLLTRLGRRNTHTTTTQEEFKVDDDILESPLSLSSGKSVTSDNGPVAPPRSRKTGWSDEFKINKHKTSSSVNDQDRHQSKDKHEREDDIPVIPDLDEILEDTSINEMNNALSNRRNRVATYKELDTDFLKKASFVTIDDIDLSLLAEKLYPEKMVQEADEVWNWDTLFTQITSEINSENRAKGSL